MILEKALEALRRYPLCDHCLGRLFALLGMGLDNRERGRAIKDVLLMQLHERIIREGLRDELIGDLKALARSGHEPSIRLLESLGHKVEVKPCYICGGMFEKIDEMTRSAIERLKDSNVEFRKFRVGCKVPNEILQREIELTLELGLSTTESIKRELNREIGKRIKELLGSSAIVDKDNPDIELVVDPVSLDVNIVIKPVYIYARYRKLLRTQSVLGGFKMPLDYVRSLFNGDDVITHAAGDEPCITRVLGEGRPVVFQVENPRRRPCEDEVRKALERRFENVEFLDVSYTRPSVICELKEKSREFTVMYRILALSNGVISTSALSSLCSYFRNRQVVHYLGKGRRMRKRVSIVYEVKARLVTDNLVEFLVKCKGNLYVRGFVHGAEGKVEPSLSGVLGVQLEPIEIDILSIYD